jgi:hypothetical protein
MHNYIIKIPDGPAYEVTQQKLDRYIASGEIPENALGRRSDSKEYLPIKDMLAWCAAHPEIQPQPLGQAGTLGGEVGGCLFLLIIGGIIITLVVGWVRRQESLSESLGEAAGKVAKPVKQEWESFKKGFNEERN